MKDRALLDGEGGFLIIKSPDSLCRAQDFFLTVQQSVRRPALSLTHLQQRVFNINPSFTRTLLWGKSLLSQAYIVDRRHQLPKASSAKIPPMARGDDLI